MPQLRNVLLATGLGAFAAAGLAFPFILAYDINLFQRLTVLPV